MNREPAQRRHPAAPSDLIEPSPDGAAATRAPVRAIVLDLDGILVDSAADVHGALNRLLLSMKRPLLPVEEVKPWIGLGPDLLVRHAIAASGPEATDLALPDLVERFVRLHRGSAGRNTHLFPGTHAVLDDLARRGIALALCTNRGYRAALESIAAHRLRFSVVIGGDSLPVRKPEPLPILEALQRLRIDRRHAVVLADGDQDIRAARAARMRCIGVTYGYARYHPDRFGLGTVIDRLTELPAAIDALEAGNGLTDWEIDWQSLGRQMGDRLLPARNYLARTGGQALALLRAKRLRRQQRLP